MFDITSMTANAEDVVLTLGWTYTTDAGSRGGTLKLAMPAGSESLADLTKADLLGWLSAQLPEDVEEQLDAQIEKDNAAKLIREVEVPA